jgi:inner membrane protein
MWHTLLPLEDNRRGRIVVASPREARGRRTILALALILVVLIADLGIWALEPSTAVTGLLDEPAHLATCALLLVAALSLGFRLPGLFVIAALIASTAIDIDHIPAYLGWDDLTDGAPRPVTHGLATVLALLVMSAVTRGTLRTVLAGAAFGVCMHLFRDVATSDGLAPFEPIGDARVRIPYLGYIVPLAAIAAWLQVRLREQRTRPIDARATSARLSRRPPRCRP